jgi:predicted Zn-dependent protease
MTIPPAVQALPDPTRERCEAAYDRVQRRTGKLALEVGDHDAAAAAYQDLTRRHPENRAFWRQLSKALRGLGRGDEADAARQRGRELKAAQARA